ncbi:hypothetical protein OAH91_06055, partial [Emcibacteraceae bacterium]|nr:hypothetical protein [Emcibacteraceae bacterium]
MPRASLIIPMLKRLPIPNGDFNAVQQISTLMKETIVCSLARASIKDIDRAWEALKGARRPRIHTFISTSAL